MSKKDSKSGWIDVPHDGRLESFAEKNGIKSEFLEAEEGVIILPQNRFFTDFKDDLNLFPQVTKNIFTTIRDAGLQAKIYNDNRSPRELVLKSTDIVLPILFFIGSTAVTVVLSLLSSWIYDNYIKPGTKKVPRIRVEYAELNEKGIISKWKRIEAPASDIYSILRTESHEIRPTKSLELTKTDYSEKSIAPTTEKAKETDWWEDNCEKQASIAYSTANELVAELKKLLINNEIAAAEKLARRSLQKLRESCLWEPDSKKYKISLHRIGRLVHDTFGCTLEFKDGSYWVTCSVMLLHSRGGFSIGGSGKTVCSICGQDLLFCPHDKGKNYNNVTARRIDGICNICGESECDHKEGVTYDNVRSFGIVVEMALDHVSFVENPSNPLCVVQSYSLSEKELLQSLPRDEYKHFVFGKTIIHCHHCTICNGT